jgi:8-oxo-dGTP diphosphatase
MPARYCYDHPRPQVAVDVAVFTLLERSVCILLVRRKHEPFAGRWALPGGFLEIDEPVAGGALRELKEETGLTPSGPIEPIGFYGNPNRDPRGRTISLAHGSVTQPERHEILGGDDAAEAEWFGIEELPELAFDHDAILKDARDWLRRGVLRGSLGLSILPSSFTVADVEALFKGLRLRRKQGISWLERMRAAGRISPTDRDGEYFHMVDSAS